MEEPTIKLGCTSTLFQRLQYVILNTLDRKTHQTSASHMNAFGSAWVAAKNFPRRIYRIKESVIWASVLAETDFGPAFWNRDEVCVHGVVLLPGRVLLGHVNAKLFHLGQKFRLVITQRTSGKQIQKSSENWMPKFRNHLKTKPLSGHFSNGGAVNVILALSCSSSSSSSVYSLKS